MTSEINRRAFLSVSLTFAAVAGLAGCVPSVPRPSPVSSPSGTGKPTAAPSATAEPTDGSARPALASSFGPNATHYPDDLPWLGDTAATELVAECEWTDIARKIQGVTAEQAAAGVVIRVRPGELAGAGAGSSSPAVLTGVGNPAWTRNVVICPLDGFGTVTVSDAGSRMDQCARLAFYGLLGAGAFTMTRCDNLQVGWSRFDAMNITRGGRDIALYEVVLGFRRNAEDTVGVRPTETFEMTNITRYGCVFGPSIKPDGSGAHCDTIQLEGTGTGTFGPFVSTDCVDYGSSNSAELLNDKLSLADYRHCMILGGDLPWRVFPLQPGDYAGTPNAFAGGCADVRLTDSIVAGAVGRMGFTQLQNTALSYSPSSKQQPSVSGAWSVETAVAGWSGEQIMAQQAIPNYETSTLQGLWTWK